jgi:HlyD family secretion protein
MVRARLIAVVAVVAVLGIAAFVAMRALRPAAPSTQLAVSGRIEGYQTDLGAKTGGRIAWIAVREGAFVHAGDVVVRLDDAQARAQLAAASAAVVAADERARQSTAALGVLESQLHESSLSGAQAAADTSGRVAQAQGVLAAAQAQVAQAEAAVRQAEANVRMTSDDRARYAALARSGDVPAQQAEHADAAYRTATAALAAQQAAQRAAQRNAAAARGALALARSTSYNVPIRGAQATTLQRQAQQVQAQIAAARAEADQARALRRQAQATLDDLIVRAASDGTVIARPVEPGDVVAPGRTLLSVVDLGHVYLRGFVPEGQIGRVRVGQTAHVALDSDPRHPLDGAVSEVDAQASFTPENIYFRDDRVQQVFGVKIEIRTPGGYAKPGMPADATIDLGT